MSTSFKEIMQRAVNAEVKIGLKSSIIVQNLDACFSKGYRLSHKTFLKVQTQGSTAKKSKLKEFKPKESKSVNERSSVLFYTNKPFKLNCKDMKKKWLKKKDSIMAIRDNAIKSKKKQTHNNTSQIICYNCQKKNHFANKYIELKN